MPSDLWALPQSASLPAHLPPLKRPFSISSPTCKVRFWRPIQQYSKTFITLLFILNEKALVSSHWGLIWLSQQFYVPEKKYKLKFSTKIASQGEMCFLVTNSAVMFSDTCFRFLIGSAGIISLLSVFDHTDIINHTCSKFSSHFDSPGCPQSMGDNPACSAVWIPTPRISSWHLTSGYSLSQFPTFKNPLWILRLYQNIENSRWFWIILYEET